MDGYYCPACSETMISRTGLAPASQVAEFDSDGSICSCDSEVMTMEHEIEWNDDWECSGCGRAYDIYTWHHDLCGYCEEDEDNCCCKFCDSCGESESDNECVCKNNDPAQDDSLEVEHRLNQGVTINPFEQHLVATVMGRSPNGKHGEPV